MAQASDSRDEDLLCCSICLELFKDPVTIPCGHSYCMTCLTQLWDREQAYHCPQCRASFSPRPTLCRNNLLMEILQSFKALKNAAPSAPPLNQEEHGFEHPTFDVSSVQPGRIDGEMEPARKRKSSSVWENFELIAHNKVRCLLCDKELMYSNNTSSMLRHSRALHQHAQAANRPDTSQNSRKAMVDEALVRMIIKDCQPFSIVEDVGFRELVHALDPNYLLPNKKALKVMVDTRYREAKEKAKEQVKWAAAVSLSSEMWTSVNMDASLAVTCHYISDEDRLCTALLGVQHFPKDHTAEDLAAGHVRLMVEWGITDKVKCLVTDGAAKMNACARKLNIQHIVCLAHTINSIVLKSFEDVPGLSDLRHKCRKLVTLFRTSTAARERLVQIQEQMGRQPYKMILEVDTRWNSTFHMLERLYDLREPVGAALASLKTEVIPLTASEYEIIKHILHILEPFHQATVEVSSEERVWGSKVIPLMKMLHHTVTCRLQTLVTSNTMRRLGGSLVRRLKEHIYDIESVDALTMPALLDPRFKTVGFLSSTKTQEAINRLTNECVALMTMDFSAFTAFDPEQAVPGGSSSSGELWELLDADITTIWSSSSVSADATLEVECYLAEVIISRAEDPLVYWSRCKIKYPRLYKLALTRLCLPASPVPCDRVFSKAGEMLCKKRNFLNPGTLEKLLFLNRYE